MGHGLKRPPKVTFWTLSPEEQEEEEQQLWSSDDRACAAVKMQLSLNKSSLVISGMAVADRNHLNFGFEQKMQISHTFQLT